LLTAAAWATAAGAAGAEAVTDWEQKGRNHFLECEFKQAARAFEKALTRQQDRAVLHYWLGESYVRMAEVSNPLTAAKHARRARRSLEQAVRMDPRNDEYLLALFDLYVDSPEFFRGGLARAAALAECIGRGGSGREIRLRQLADSRRDHSGAGWWMRRAFLWTSGAIAELVLRP
jgi:tetratricopeptide (TPR) repeat protein